MKFWNMNEIKNIPEHVSIIMDGNGRWARQRGLERVSGHYNGVESVSSRGERTINSDFAVGYLESGGIADLHGQGGGDGAAVNVVLTHDDLSFLIKVLKIRLSLEVLSSTGIVP